MTDPHHSELVSLLERWFDRPGEATIQPLGGAGGFSGARLWRVSIAGDDYALRRWPATIGSAQRVELISRFQRHLAAAGLPVPQPALLREGAWVFAQFDSSGSVAAWSLTKWLPGVADYWQTPRPEKLSAACALLARLHLAAASFDAPDGNIHAGVAVSPSMLKRVLRMESLPDSLAEFRRRDFADLPLAERDLASETCANVAAAAPGIRHELARWVAQPLTLQWRLGDVWHDHVLFTGDTVTGVIDFGAAGIDSPEGDVARLLGSLVGDDRERWRQGLLAYEAVRPLDELQRQAADAFDTSGTVIAAANWLAWLWPANPASAPPLADRPAALARLRALNARLSRLVDSGGTPTV